MSRVVRPRRQLVDQEPPIAGDEHLDREQPDQIERGRDPLGEHLRLVGEIGRDRRRRDRPDQDLIAMPVLDRHVAHLGAVLAPCGDHRDLALEIDPAFKDRGRGGRGRPGVVEPGAGLDPDLSLAVVAKARGLEDRRPAELGQCVVQGFGVLDDGIGRGRHADPAEERLLLAPVLADREHRGRGVHRPRRASVASASTGRFSNSMVTTSTAAAKRASAPTSS